MLTKESALVAIILVAIAAGVALRVQPGGFRGWMAEVRDGDGDWGWEELSEQAQQAYGGNRDAYLADMTAADWEELELANPIDVWSDDGFVRVVAELQSSPITVPAFLLERRIVHGVCDAGNPTAIGVYEDRRPFQGGKFDGGGVTGSQARCNAAFRHGGE